MDKILASNEIRFNDLIGIASINLKEETDFNKLSAEIAGYDPQKFTAVALRVFIEAKPVVTIYAKEKSTEVSDEEKLPVHKFKKVIGFEELFSKFKEFNFTVTTGEYEIDNMEVVNR